MKIIDKAMTAMLVKEGRLAKGYTQKELSELSNISIRSIQRIENGEILPRSYTLKTIAEIIEVPFENFLTGKSNAGDASKQQQITERKNTKSINKTQKIILSVGIPVAIILMAIAFLAQAGKFPETVFETFAYWCTVSILLFIILYFIWHEKN